MQKQKRSAMNKMSTFEMKKGSLSHLQLKMCNAAEGPEILFVLPP